MANIITAGNSTNGGTAISTDTSGTLNIVTGSGSGATAVTVDGSGNVVITGTLSASGGVSGGIRSGTAVASTSGTSIDFTSIPSGVKRITVMFNGVSTNGSSNPLIQIGAGSVTTSGYLGASSSMDTGVGTTNYAAGFGIRGASASNVLHGSIVLTNITGNSWTTFGNLAHSNTAAFICVAGSISLSGTLDRVRITTVNGTDTFDAGSINILFE
jgi:hypothetical protein